MSIKLTHKITLPERIKNPIYNNRTIEVNGKEHSFWNGKPEFFSIKNNDENLLKDGFSKIEKLAYSDYQLKINQHD